MADCATATASSTPSDGRKQVYWQGPSVGWDLGGDGNRTMMLVYDLPNSLSIYRRYGGVNGSAYLVGGLGMTVLANTQIPGRDRDSRADPQRRRRPAGGQCGLSEVHPAADVEPVLMREAGAQSCPNGHTCCGFSAKARDSRRAGSFTCLLLAGFPPYSGAVEGGVAEPS